MQEIFRHKKTASQKLQSGFEIIKNITNNTRRKQPED